MNDPIRDLEAAFVAHWSLLGAGPGGRVVDDAGALRFETPLRKLPFNGVIRTAIAGRTEEIVARIVAAHAERDADFFWLVHPTATPGSLGHVLSAAGLAPVERTTGMILDLADWQPSGRPPPEGVELGPVADDEGLKAYEDLVISHWELDEGDREHVAQLNRSWPGRTTGERFVAWLDGRPVGKGWLSLAGPPGVAAIYGMGVRPDARGRGLAAALVEALVAQAKALGLRRVVLHSSGTAADLYRRAGFVERCRFTFFATAPIWIGDH